MKTKRYHIIIDVGNIEQSILNDRESLAKFLMKLPEVIGMHVLKGPVIEAGIPQNPGLSGFVIIDYSHISIHTFTLHGEALVDIFSCKPYQQEVATRAVLDYFKISSSQANIQQVSWS